MASIVVVTRSEHHGIWELATGPDWQQAVVSGVPVKQLNVGLDSVTIGNYSLVGEVLLDARATKARNHLLTPLHTGTAYAVHSIQPLLLCVRQNERRFPIVVLVNDDASPVCAALKAVA